MANMTHVWWRAGGPRRGRIIAPIASSHPGYPAPCLLCPRPLGGQGTQALDLQLLVVGPARGDQEAAQRHDAGHWYNAAALVVHAECLALMTDDDIERLVPELVMVARADLPTANPAQTPDQPGAVGPATKAS